MDAEACTSHNESHRRSIAWDRSILCELFFAAGASTITTSYTVHHEQRLLPDADSELQNQTFESEHLSFILDPSPTLMFGACLILGCALSSYAYRQQESDQYQTLIFVFAVTTACTVGYFQDIKPNLVMLALIPWALCMAIVVSTVLHWLLRTINRRAIFQEIEKEMLTKY